MTWHLLLTDIFLMSLFQWLQQVKNQFLERQLVAVFIVGQLFPGCMLLNNEKHWNIWLNQSAQKTFSFFPKAWLITLRPSITVWSKTTTTISMGYFAFVCFWKSQRLARNDPNKLCIASRGRFLSLFCRALCPAGHEKERLAVPHAGSVKVTH